MLTVMEGAHPYTVVAEPGPQRFAALSWAFLQAEPVPNNVLSTALLYTDRANPTSNKIYQSIGYQPIGEAANWAFDH